MVDPARLVWGLRNAAESLGARFFDHSAVVGVDRSDGNAIEVATAYGSVRADRVIVGTFVLAGFLAAAAMLLFSVQRPVITPDWGLQIAVVALVGVVVGGLDRLVPATMGGFFVGFANSMLANILPSDQRIFLDSALYTLVILVLLVQPAGLFQRHVTVERV